MIRSPNLGLDEQFVPVRRLTVHTVELDGEAVLLDQDAQRLHRLNATAAVVWAGLDGTASVGDLVTALSAELGAPRGIVLVDTLAVVEQFGQEGLLENVETRPADHAPPRKAVPTVTSLPPPASSRDIG